jgi:hypothetical protein
MTINNVVALSYYLELVLELEDNDECPLLELQKKFRKG